jgi:hypothetical protein
VSEHGHAGEHASAADFAEAAEHEAGVHSRGHISPLVWMFIGVTLVIIFWQGYNVISSGGDAHVWPASNAVKVDLPAQKP